MGFEISLEQGSQIVPTIEDNLRVWSTYDWSGQGHEWNGGYGGTEVAWHCVIKPRLQRFLPTGHILEIAPGHGVWTEYLRPLCKKMTLVDLTPSCIEACRKKFGRRGMTYIVNDGRSLQEVKDNSISLVFSWHSLVHAESDVMEAYIAQLAKKLVPGGYGLIHHSNFGAYIDLTTGKSPIDNVHWRGTSMTAQKFREGCASHGLVCLSQELVPWGWPQLTDAFSFFGRPRGAAPHPSTTIDECPTLWDTIRDNARVYERYRAVF